MTGLIWGVLGFLAALATTVLSDMVSEEVRARLDHLPHAILRLAARRLTSAQQTAIYQDEWLPELTYILKGAETRPITRLITGTRYALGILASTGRIAQHVHRTANPQPLPAKTPGEILAERVAALANTKLTSHGIDYAFTDESVRLIVGQVKQTPPHPWPSAPRSARDRRRRRRRRQQRE
jgi:hypothetical protein